MSKLAVPEAMGYFAKQRAEYLRDIEPQQYAELVRSGVRHRLQRLCLGLGGTMKVLSADEIMNRAKEKIIPLESQKETVQNIASLLSLHLKRLNALDGDVEEDFLPRFSELIIAPTGSGKTYLISKLAEAAGLPFYTIDCSMLTLSGYKGVNLSEAFRSLKAHCSKPSDFERAVILFDEFDKCSYRSGENGNVQPNFLKLLEGEPISCDEKRIETKEMLFLFAGAFQGLDKLTEQRRQKKTIGFASEQTETKAPVPTMDDVEAYGFSRELLGRIGSLHCIPTMKIEDYIRLLIDGKASIAEKFGALFAAQGVQFFVDEDACVYLGEQAMKRGMGARAMEAIVKEQVLQAVGEIDRDKRIVEAVLTVKDGEFAFQYRYGEREMELLEEVMDVDVELFSEQTKRQDIEGEKTTFDVLMEEAAVKNENSTHHAVQLQKAVHHKFYKYPCGKCC